MPAASQPAPGLTDTWGRRNRKLADRSCGACGSVFRPKRAASAFCSHPCARTKNGGHNRKPGPIWWVNQRGYVEGKVWSDGRRVTVKQHRWIMEVVIGRPLESHEDVHHLDGDRQNNDPANLQLLAHGEHATVTNLGRTYKRGYRLKSRGASQ